MIRNDVLSFFIDSISIKILKSGFKEHDKTIYHVIVEDGEFDISIHQEMTSENIKKEYNINIEKEYNNLLRVRKLKRIL